MRVASLTTAVVAVMGAAAAPASAGAIFDLGPVDYMSVRGSDDGLGQGVGVATSAEIQGFSFFGNLPNGADVTFMIWDGANSTLLFSQTDTFAASSDGGWFGTAPLDFNLVAGNTYWFGVIADDAINVGYLYPAVSYSANGLTAIETGNSNYDTFANPAFAGLGTVEIGLQINGVPEASTWAMLVAGFAGLGCAARGRSRTASTVRPGGARS